MEAKLFRIAARRKEKAFQLTSPDDFDLVPEGRIGVAELAASPDWTLYAVDIARQQAVLVLMPPGTDLSAATFVYHHQYENALRAAIVDFGDLIAASHAITPPQSLSFLFSTGRCGSTLASRIFAQLPDVWSLSEPDVMTGIAVARLSHARADLVALLRATTLWTCRPPAGHAPRSIILKPRSEVTLIAELCQEAFPQSRNVFMYRDLLGFLNSISKFLQRAYGPAVILSDAENWREFKTALVGTPVSVLEECFPPDHGPIIWPEFITLMWDLRIEGYLKALRRGMTFTAVHYTDLNRNRRAETARLLAGCGIAPEHLDLAMHGFDQDSHQGSITRNDTPAMPLSPVHQERALTLLARLGKRDYVDARLPQ